ncbi:MAG: 3-dehydroquinate synthase family protein [Planctomycetota bacterium]
MNTPVESHELLVPGARSQLLFGPIEAAPSLTELLPTTPSSAVIVSDARISTHFRRGCCAWVEGSGIPTTEVTVSAGETLKSIPNWQRLLDRFHGARLDRGGVVVAVGGGTLSDAVGYAAASWQRGVPWVVVPTTLLAMVDAAIGGKTGLNHCGVKNQVGAFHLPAVVQVDDQALQTLSAAEIRSGWGELLKAAVIGDADLFESMERGALSLREAPPLNVIARAAQIKAEVVALDYAESGRRMVLNLGHTLGHALESESKHRGLAHGDAVMVGLIFAARVAEDMELAAPRLAERLDWVLSQGDFPRRWNPAISEPLLSLIARDKKNRGDCLWMALPKDIGDVEVVEVPRGVVASRLRAGF